MPRRKYFEGQKIKLQLRDSSVANSTSSEWEVQRFMSVLPVDCEEKDCFMTKALVCSKLTTSQGKESCCTQKRMVKKSNLTDQGLVDFKLGEVP